MNSFLRLFKIGWVALLLQVAISTLLLAQSSPSSSPPPSAFPPVPPSPTAAALGTYGNVPVGYHTGIPSISIPIWELTSRDLKLPISLSYYSTGLRVDDMASSAGLGWVLNAGSSVSRTVFGLDDLLPMGYAVDEPLPPYGTVPAHGQLGSAAQKAYDLAYDVMEIGQVDLEPDVFNFSLNGRSGRFVYGKDRKPHTIPHQPLLIEQWNPDNAPANGFRIVDEAGIMYCLDAGERTEIVNDSQCPLNLNTKQPRGDYVTNYQVRWMISPANDTIKFTYEDDVSAYRNPTSEDVYTLLPGCTECRPIYPVPCGSITNHEGRRLRQIATATGQRAVFEYDAATRLDLLSSHRLRTISIYNAVGECIRRFDLHHSYFRGVETGETDPLLRQLSYRMRLDSVQEQGKPAYIMSYYNQQELFPARLSKSQDWWGYYNAKANTTLVPAMEYGGRFYSGANREVDTVTTRYGMLRSIRYPTGGQSVFDFELHRLDDIATYADSVIDVNAHAVLTSEHTSQQFEEKTIQFTLTRQEGVRISYRFATSSAAPGVVGGIAFGTIRGVRTGVEYRYGCSQGTTCQDDFVISLPPDTYTVYVSTEANTEPSSADASIAITRKGLIYLGMAPQYVGGCRIRRITDYAQDGKVATSRSFVYKDPRSGLSSSIGGIPPKLDYTYNTQHFNSQEEIWHANNYLVRVPRSVIPQAAQTSTIGYASVTELFGANGIGGRSDYYYSATEDAVTHVGYPFTPPINYEWARGQLIKQVDYAWRGGIFHQIRSVRHRFKQLHDRADFLNGRSLSVNEYIIPGVSVGYIRPQYTLLIPGGGTSSVGILRFSPAQFHFNWYFHVAAWQYLSSTEEKLYNPADTTLFTATLTRYRYDNAVHLQATRVTKTTSTGDSTWVASRYAPDYERLTGTQSSPSLVGLQQLQDRHQFTAPVEQIQGGWKGGNSLLTSGLLIEYAQHKPWRFQHLNTVAPIAASQFRQATVQAGVWQVDPRYYVKEEVETRDAVGNPLQIKQSEMRTSFVWGNKRTEMQAQVRNATHAQIGYASFEARDLGTWTGAVGGVVVGGYIGSHSYNLRTSSLRQASVPPSTYTCSVWVKEGSGSVAVNGRAVPAQSLMINGWRLHQVKLTIGATAPVTVSGTGQIDELRLHPADAQMTSYAYRHLVGLSSQTNPDGRTVHYEYDALGRLQQVKDEQGRVVQAQDYHYARP